MARGPAWAALDAVQRHPATRLNPFDLPAVPGLVVWFQGGEPYFIAVARGAGGLRARVTTDMARGMNLAHSAFRIAVAVAVTGVDADTARSGTGALTPAQVGAVNRWVEQSEVGWVECADVRQANALERALRAEWVPPLNAGPVP